MSAATQAASGSRGRRRMTGGSDRQPAAAGMSAALPNRSLASLPFVLGIAGLLAGGLLALLIINNELAAGSFEAERLRADATLLGEQEQALNQEVERLSSPTRLRQAAKDLGLIPAASTAYVDLRDGRILGTPLPAGGPYYVPPRDDEPTAMNPDGSDGAARVFLPGAAAERPLVEEERPPAEGEGDGASVAPSESAYDRAVVSGEER